MTTAVDKPLSDQERLFVNEYIKNGCNSVQAALVAGYSPRSVNGMATDIRNRPHVDAEISRRLARAEAKADIKAEEILAELKLMGFSDIADLLEDDGTGQPKMRKWGEIPRNVTKALKEMTIDTVIEGKGVDKEVVRRVKFKMHDKQQPLELLARYLKMIGEKNGGGDTTNTLVVFQNAVSAADRFIAEALARGPGNGA